MVLQAAHDMSESHMRLDQPVPGPGGSGLVVMVLRGETNEEDVVFACYQPCHVYVHHWMLP